MGFDPQYANTVYKTEKETEHTVTALAKTYHKNDIAPLTESQYKALNLQVLRLNERLVPIAIDASEASELYAGPW